MAAIARLPRAEAAEVSFVPGTRLLRGGGGADFSHLPPAELEWAAGIIRTLAAVRP